MNELQLIRGQLAVERQHAAEVANACASALQAGAQGSLPEFRQACVDYLVWVLSRFEERDQTILDLTRSRALSDAAARKEIEELISRPGKSREALAKLELALSAAADSARWREFGQFFNGTWRTRRDAIDAFFERNARVSDWRAVAAIDADSILEERSRYTRVRESLPKDIALRAPAA